ncbi:hypothetical protein CEUSTIGMA_g9640.t1 [Chlamydomonas eustigma]|uniref:C2 domain-containing protein n=1 Tax=Chlamydomonas eustigma TaxID=1157962 RepID=A0A250XH15_9CHLO|nr:hypothetical protein CEUSTIGMA_g9640.t1 [Chlamydomonas eustigma]|eukprot:GAX82212.1 hypothetical protein CEUSTIGMA_g9640.t1 [Chlamydomonas eustigma]
MEDLITGTSLPPGVDGRPKGEIHARFGNVHLGTTKRLRSPSGPTLLFVRWWGDAGPGICLHLAPGSYGEIHFPVRCGPRHLVRYLRDMSSLVLVLEEAYTHAPLGRCAVDVRFLDLSRPVSGTFPILLPQNASHVDGALAVGTMMRHVGTLDVHLEIGFTSTNMSSFEINEHLADQSALGKPFPSVQQRSVNNQSPMLPPQKPSNSAIQHFSVSDVARFDEALQQLDLFEVLLDQMQKDFNRFCDIFDEWRTSLEPGTANIGGLLQQLQAQRIFQRNISEEQHQYLQYMVDPKGDLQYTLDEVMLAFRQSLEAGVRVRNAQLQEVIPLLAPLALHLQQGLILMRQAFRASVSPTGEQGFMTIQHLVSVLHEILPPMERQQVRYLVCMLAHQGSTGHPGWITFQDLQSFLRQAAAWGGVNNDLLVASKVVAAADSPSDVSKSATMGRLFSGSYALSGPPQARQWALSRLKNRLQIQRTGPAAVQLGDAIPQILPAQIFAVPTTNKTVLQSIPASLPEFKELNPSLPTDQRPGMQHTLSPPSKPHVVTEDPVAVFLRQAEALRMSLSEAVSKVPASPSSSLIHYPSNGENHYSRDSASLSLLKFIQEDKGVSQPLPLQSRSFKGSSSAQQQAWLARHPGDDVSEGYESEGDMTSSHGHGNENSREETTDADQEEDEDEEEAAAWSERQLLDHLFFPPASTRKVPGDKDPDSFTPNKSGRNKPDTIPKPDAPVDQTAGGGQLDKIVDHSGEGDKSAPSPHQPQSVEEQDPVAKKPSISQPVLQVEVIDLNVPDKYQDLSFVVKASSLSSLSQRQHWSVCCSNGESNALAIPQPLLSFSLPAHTDIMLPSPVIFELWSGRTELVGMAQLLLQPPPDNDLQDNGSSAFKCQPAVEGMLLQAYACVSVPLQNPLMNKVEREELERCGKIKIQAGIFAPHVVEAKSQGLLSDHAPGAKEGVDALHQGSVMFSHTFRVTVCGGVDLPDPQSLVQQELPVPHSRFLQYIYPGDSEPLFTDDVPCEREPIFAASAAHTIVMAPEADVMEQLKMASGNQSTELKLEVWDRWSNGSAPTLMGSASLTLQLLAQLAKSEAGEASLLLKLPLEQVRTPHIAHASVSADAPDGVDNSSVSIPALEVKIQYQRETHHHTAPDLSTSDEHDTGNTEVEQDFSQGTVEVPSTVHQARSPPELRGMEAVLSVSILQACGLQAAVLDAQAWLGSAGALLGRSHLVGPNPYATLNLLPGSNVRGRLPIMKTPYLAQTFCPEFNWQADVALLMDAPVLEAMATRHLCVELWHHTSRSLAVALGEPKLPKQQQDVHEEQHEGRSSGVQDILLGCASHALSHLLLKPQGVSAWLLLKSQRGEPVGAVQLSLCIKSINNQALDQCIDAPPPLSQVPGLINIFPTTAVQYLLAGQAPWIAHQLQGHPEATLGPARAPLLPSGFEGQWSRLTFHVDQLVIPSPGSAAELRPRAYKYYITYTLPGSSDEIHTAAQTAKMQQQSSPNASSAAAAAAAVNVRTSLSAPGSVSWHVPLQHCGVHWVQAGEALAASLLGMPLRIKAYRAHSRAATQLGTPAAWLSSSLCGETMVDMSSMVAASGVRKHQPHTRWLSGTYTLIDPTAKMFSNSRVTVRALLELLPTTLPPTSWLTKSAWQPVVALQHTRPMPVKSEQLVDTSSASVPSSAEEKQHTASVASNTLDTNIGVGSIENSAVTQDLDEAVISAGAVGREDLGSTMPGLSRTATGGPLGAQADVMLGDQGGVDDDDWMFSFKKILPVVSMHPVRTDAEYSERTGEGTVSLVGHPEVLDVGIFTSQACEHDGTTASGKEEVSAVADQQGSLDGSAGGTLLSDKEALRRKLQELEDCVTSMGWRCEGGRGDVADGSKLERQHDGLTGLSNPRNEVNVQKLVSSLPTSQVQPVTFVVLQSSSVFVPTAHSSSSPDASTSKSLLPKQPVSGTSRSAPYVAATCSEDEEETFVLGDYGGSDTDDTDELLASKSRYVVDNGAAATRLQDQSIKGSLGREGTSNENHEDSRLGTRRHMSAVTALTSGREVQEGGVQSNEDWMFEFGVSARSARKTAQQTGNASSSSVLHPSMVHPGMSIASVHQTLMKARAEAFQKNASIASTPHTGVATSTQSIHATDSRRENAAGSAFAFEPEVQVQRVHHSPSSHNSLKFRNALPSVPSDFKLEYM